MKRKRQRFRATRTMAAALLVVQTCSAAVPVGTVLPEYGLGDVISNRPYVYFADGVPDDLDPDVVVLNGLVVLVVLTTAGCTNCNTQLLTLKALYEKYQSYGFVILAVYVDAGSPSQVISVAQSNHLVYPAGLLNTLGLGDAFHYNSGTDAPPHHYVVNREGVVVEHYIGGGSFQWQESLVRPHVLGLPLSPPIQVHLNPAGTSDPGYNPGNPDTNHTLGTNGVWSFTVPSTSITWSTNWPTTFQIQEATNITGPWTDRNEAVIYHNGSPDATNGNYDVRIPRTNAAPTVFYRLKKNSLG